MYKAINGQLTVLGELDVGDGLCVVVGHLDLLVGLDVPLHDVAVVVAGDELLVQRAPHHRRHLGALGGDGDRHHGLVWNQRGRNKEVSLQVMFPTFCFKMSVLN